MASNRLRLDRAAANSYDGAEAIATAALEAAEAAAREALRAERHAAGLPPLGSSPSPSPAMESGDGADADDPSVLPDASSSSSSSRLDSGGVGIGIKGVSAAVASIARFVSNLHAGVFKHGNNCCMTLLLRDG